MHRRRFPPGRASIDEGDAKPEREYDEFLSAALNDIQQWWSEQYPAIYDGPLTPLRGGVYAAYPERTDPIPGCGQSTETTYDEITEFAAFYCPEGDFIVYDDGEDGVLFSARRGVRTDDPRRGDGPRVRPRDPGARR